ncbi:hypothetical protein [Bdellovibrio bacteriovorus]|uniref:hypothetical protein n=1 Tax=Bdellovibrio bacteriovorus TaxID=959 RepID=UPI0035A6498F
MATFPENWPRNKKYKISHKKSKTFFQTRFKESLEGMNIILILHNSNQDVTANGTVALFKSILKELDNFAADMLHLPGAKSILEPLWNDGWNPLRFWGVVSEVYYARHLKNLGFKIDGFDRRITQSSKTADILTTTPDQKKLWIDIEALSCTKKPSNAQDFRRLIEYRAKKKMQTKFSTLPKNEIGVVACVYRYTNENSAYLGYMSEATDDVQGPSKNVFASVYWLASAKPNENPENRFLQLCDRYLPNQQPT